METAASRLRKVLRGERPEDRLPCLEWASWWDLTIKRWHSEGLPDTLDGAGIQRFFGLDVHHQHWFWPGGSAKALYPNDQCWIKIPSDYDSLRGLMYPCEIGLDPLAWDKFGDIGDIRWVTFNGFFWWPRVLFGIEAHLYAFYDFPELMHQINEDLTNHIKWLLRHLPFRPDFITLGEDMSYNHGPMLSRELFLEFLAPYYREIAAELAKDDIPLIVDSDGQVDRMVPWLIEVGVDGILPLERRAGVEVASLRACYPDFAIIGGFDKTVMHLGETAMRTEFDRLAPVIRQGRFVPSVDHQTPPDVSIQNYQTYVRLQREYAMSCL